MQKQTKIVCTIGPASEDKVVIRKMIEAGMNCARLNFSHGTYEHHQMLISHIREAAKELDQPVAILADLQGPRIRVGALSENGLNLKSGDFAVLFPERISNFQFPIFVPPGHLPEGDNQFFSLREISRRGTISNSQIQKIPVTYELHNEVKTGDKILLDEGMMQLEVLEVKDKTILCKVIIGGKLTSHKGINIPKSGLKISSITEKDKCDLEFAIKNNVEWVAMSFVKTAEDVKHLKNFIKKIEEKYKVKEPTMVVAKIEKSEAVENIDKIIEVADGIMVARGDLGIEMPIEEVPVIQKQIIKKCLEAAKPAITATQMLLSMVENPKPTRAEVSDVANAVIDHTDAVMLSQESAMGKYPVETVEMMSHIIRDTEISPFDDLKFSDFLVKNFSMDEATASSVTRLAKDVGAKAILVATISGHTARMVSRFRPELPIVVTAEGERIRRQLALSWGVVPYVLPKCKSVDELISRAVAKIKEKGIVSRGEKVIVLGGHPVGKSGNVNLIKIQEI